MIEDIVDRLRTVDLTEMHWDEEVDTEETKLCHEAAAEIERLRADLQKCRDLGLTIEDRTEAEARSIVEDVRDNPTKVSTPYGWLIGDDDTCNEILRRLEGDTDA